MKHYGTNYMQTFSDFIFQKQKYSGTLLIIPNQHTKFQGASSNGSKGFRDILLARFLYVKQAYNACRKGA